MSKKPSGKSVKVQSKATEKARRDAVAEIQQRIDAPETVNGDAGVIPGAQQVASIDVDPMVELAAAAKHAAKRGKGKTAAAPKPPRPAKARSEKKAKAPKAEKPKRISALDAAATVWGRWLATVDHPIANVKVEGSSPLARFVSDGARC